MEQWRVEPMLDFRRIEMSDFPALRKMYEKYGNWSCDCTICGTYMWRDYLDIRISLEEEKLIVYQQLDGKHLFYIPLMEDRIAGIREIVAYMKEQGEECYFYPVANEELPLFEEAGYRIETERDEGWNDYVYDITALANMKGKKYHNHKNHINKFNALYENVELLDIRDVEPAEYLQFLDDYVKSEHKKATIAKEENIKITLDHVTDARCILPQIKESGFPCICGPALTHKSKFELANMSFETPNELYKAGILFSIITDSPVIPQQYLSLSAALAAKAGLPEYEAIKAITINPAKILGLDNRVGSIKVGKDADFVICTKNILDTQNEIQSVYVDGKKAA